MNFRKADPEYVNYEPRTAEDAIEKFYRHKNLGVPPRMWPEVFVQCAAALPPEEVSKFESWLVNPQGEPTGPMLQQIDKENDALRKQLLAETERRDLAPLKEEHFAPLQEEHFTVPPDDEKSPPDDEKSPPDDEKSEPSYVMPDTTL